MKSRGIQILLFLGLLGCASLSRAQLYDGFSGQPSSIQDVLGKVRPGSVLIVSELHGHKPHHQNQLRALQYLASQGLKVSVGMEFFQAKDQVTVDRFLLKEIDENQFLKNILWGKISFDNYRAQVLFPLDHGGTTIALNASRELTDKIAKVGIAKLSQKEKALLPPDFMLGNALYLERFREVMKDHVPESAIPRYFEAQSTWDETMAYTAGEFLKRHPDQVLVIIVGDFHAAYGGGLPDRLEARGIGPVTVISQIDPKGKSQSQIQEMVLPHPKWGRRARGVWAQ